MLGLALLGGLSITAHSAATPVISAGNLQFSGISPGGVDMATGELILVMRPDLVVQGPFPLVFQRYYASMLAREGLASSRLGPNWLGSFDWKLTVAPSVATLITNRGEAIRFAPGPGGTWNLSGPTYANFKLDVLPGGTWRITNPVDRRLYFFDGTTWLLNQIMDERGNALTLSYAVGGGPLSQVSDGLGRALTFTYDPSGFLQQVGDGTRVVRFTYTGGVLSNVLDADGKPWNYAYQLPSDPTMPALLIGVLEPAGNTPFTHEYDSLGRISRQRDALSHSAIYDYDTPTGNVFTDPHGSPWTYQHNSFNQLMTRKDPNGGQTTFEYDPLGRLSRSKRPLGDAITYGYDPPSGYVNSLAFEDGTTFSFDHLSHPVGGASIFDLAAVHKPDGSNLMYGRDPAGNLTDLQDEVGLPWHGTYNSRGQILTWTNPAGGVTTFTYDPEGRPQTRKDDAGNIAQYTYDPLSRLTQINWPGGTHRRYTYDNRDHVSQIQDEAGNPWNYAYDDNGRLMTATDPLTHATGYVYDGLDRIAQVVDPLGHATLYDYDENGRLFHVTDRSGRTTTYGYDGLNRLASVADPAGAPTSFGYDENSRLIFAQDALGHSWSGLQYDVRDNLKHVTDPVSSGFDYNYDAMGRLLQATGPLGFSQSFGYDPRGLLTSFTYGSSTYGIGYTPHRKISMITDPNGNPWSRNYDPQGRLTGMSDPLGRAASYEYDALSRPNLVHLPDGSTEQITYDANGNVTGHGFTDGTSFTYGYDAANRMTSASGNSFTYDAAGRMTASNGFSYTHDFAGRLLSETLSPGKTVSYMYDPRGLPSQVSDWLGGTTSFTYDAAHRWTQMTRANGTTVDYQYDAADRLTSAVEKNPGPPSTPISSILITRDALGRPMSIDRRQPLMPGQTMPASSSFSYDIASQLNGVSHDAMGRMTVDGARAFRWDNASQLAKSSDSADSLNYTDDPFHNPKKIVRSSSGQAVDLAWGFGRGYPTNDDMAVSLPSHYRLHVRAPSGLMLYGVDGASGARSFYHYDERGNTMFLTNDGAGVTTEYAYGPFGRVAALGQTNDNPFTYGATRGMLSLGPNGSSNGLWHAGGGVYDDRTMRFISGNTIKSGQGGIGDPNLSVGIGDPGISVGVGDPNISVGIGDPGISVGVGDPNISVALNPQPFPPAPGGDVYLNPQPFPPAPGEWVALNPQPFPPAPGGSGMAEMDGNDIAIGLGPLDFASANRTFLRDVLARQESGAAMHEIGHTLGLDHGGPSFEDKHMEFKRFALFGHSTVCGDADDDGLGDTWESGGWIDNDCNGNGGGGGGGSRAKDAFIWFDRGTLGVPPPSPHSGYVRHRPKAFEIKDFSFDIENKTTIGSATGGAGGGKAKFNEFEIDPRSPVVLSPLVLRSVSLTSAPCTWCPR